MNGVELIRSATGSLREFNEAGVLGAADIHTARLIGELWQETDDRVLLAIALTVRSLRSGSICVDIARVDELILEADESDLNQLRLELTWPEPDAWLEALRLSPAIEQSATADGGRPLRLVDGLLYLERYWGEEEAVRSQLIARRDHPLAPIPPQRLASLLDELFDDTELDTTEPDQQRQAATLAALSPVTVVAGGPGTGKTTTVAKILALLAMLTPRPLSIALAAPTGKAAARLEEAVRDATAKLGDPWAQRIGELAASTLHKLLGSLYQQRTRFRHNASNPLPYDVVVVDEMSMVSLTMMARLLDALRPDARVVLVGDPDQLTSVEAGAVLADITNANLPPSAELEAKLAQVQPVGRPAGVLTSGQVVTLQHTWRFDGEIAELAQAIREGDADRAVAVLRNGGDRLSLVERDVRSGSPDELTDLRDSVLQAGRAMLDASLSGDIARALTSLDQHRVLCAHRQGPFGVSRWEAQVEAWLRQQLPGYGQPLRPEDGDWYPGQPLMVTQNDADVGLFNGDTGVLVDTEGGLRAAFARGGDPLLYSTIQLDAVVPVHAMTVHKSQGSQFKSLTLILPPVESPLLTRELLYTAVTRASEHVEVIGSVESIALAVQRPANRASGLGRRLR